VDGVKKCSKAPSAQKSGSSHYCTFGTVLATNLIQNEVTLDWHGIMGMMAAASTTTMFTASRVASNISSAQRSLYMLLGLHNLFFR
jgi:hypothetical protein